MNSLAWKALGLALISTLVVAQSNPPIPADCASAQQHFPDTAACNWYYECFDLGGEWVVLHLDCPPGGIWDPLSDACVPGDCEEQVVTTSTTTESETTTVESTTETSSTTGSTSSTDGSTSTTDGSTSTSTTVVSTSTSDGSTSTTDGSTPTSDGSTSTSDGSTSTTDMSTSSTEGSTSTSTSSEEPTTSEPTPPVFICKVEGFFAHPTIPGEYYQCVLVGGQFFYYVYTCPPLSCFQEFTSSCVVGTCPTPTTPTTTTTSTVAPGSTDMTTEGSTGESESTAATTPVPFSCTAEGIFENPLNCISYNRCIIIRGLFYYFTYTCPPGTRFDLAKQLCVVGTC